MSWQWILALTVLLNGGCSNAAETKSKASPADKTFISAASQGRLTDLQKKIKSGANVNQKNEEGQTALMAAASHGHQASVTALIEAKADLNVKDSAGQTALYYAITNEHSTTAVALIEAGADLKSLNDLDDNATIIASSVNDVTSLKAALKKDPSLVNKPNQSGKTALMEAARHGTKETISILLKAGADKKMKNKNSMTPLEIAQKAQNEDAVKLFSAK